MKMTRSVIVLFPRSFTKSVSSMKISVSASLAALLFSVVSPAHTQVVTGLAAVPDTVCSGSLCNLTGVAPGDTIFWFDQIGDTIPIGQSLSGELFPVFPTASKAYYCATSLPSSTGMVTFSYTGTRQSFTVPAGVTFLCVEMTGGRGGDAYAGWSGGNGGKLTTIIPVTPGQVLYIHAGGAATGPEGGWNGGGNGSTDYIVLPDGTVMEPFSGGGGGASDIRTDSLDPGSRIAIAAGGGGAGWQGGHEGGVGGGLTGGDGGGLGYGGTQTAGGICTDPGSCGSSGQAGQGGNGYCWAWGGAGGGGWFGGGGGSYGGGGGGSAYALPSLAGTEHFPGVNAGNGQVTLRWAPERSYVYVQVIPNQTVGVSISPEINEICEGVEIELTATPQNGGALPAYHWYVNDTLAGEDNPVFTCIVNDQDVIRCEMFSSETCTQNNPANAVIIAQTSSVPVPGDVQLFADRGLDQCLGGTINFMCWEAGAGKQFPCKPYYFVWCKDGVALDTTLGGFYSIPILSVSHSGAYTCVVYNQISHDTSNIMQLNVHEIPPAGAIGIDILNSTDVQATYIGDTAASSLYNWNFTNGQIISGTGPEPRTIRFGDANYRNISMTVSNGFCSSPVFYSETFKLEFFEKMALDLPCYIYGNSEWGDFNQDGFLDILTTGEGTTKILTNLAGDTVTEHAQALPGLWTSEAKWLDVNNDNLLDFAVTGFDSTALFTRVYRNTGNGAFVQACPDLPGVRYGSIGCLDYDNNGYTDLVISGDDFTGQPLTRLFRNQGGLAFIADPVNNANLRQLARSAIECVDLDNDTYVDLLISGRDSLGPYTIVYRNQGGLFAEVPAGLTGTWSGDITAADYDNDGYTDLAVSGYKSEPIFNYNATCVDKTEAVSLILYKNNGGSVFTQQYTQNGSRAHYSGETNFGDLDNDGKADLYATGFAGNHSCYISIGGGGGGNTDIYASGRTSGFIWGNQGNGIFTDLAVDIPRAWFQDPWGGWTYYLLAPDRGCYSLAISPGDFDRDGRLDVLKGGLGMYDGIDFRSAVYRNQLPGVNTPPAVPSGLAVNVVSDTAFFSWDPASDPETPVQGLSYNLRVGTCPGGNDVISSLSDTGGLRRIVAMGNAFQNTAWHLNGLAAGTYYWSVQSIDNSYAGSPWAPEQSFTVIPGIPAATVIADDSVHNLQSECYQASGIITVAGQGTVFRVLSGGSATLIAGEKISYLPGTAVEQGGYMHGRIAPSGPWCGTLKSSFPYAQSIDGRTVPNPRSRDHDLTLYPNPTTGEFILELGEEVTGNPVRVQVYDLTGNMMIDQNITSGRKFRHNLTGRKPGIYMLRVLEGTECHIHKIVLL